MDQGGPKHDGNRDGSLTFGEAGGRLGGDPVGSLLQPAVHLPALGSLPSPTVSSAGQGPAEDHLELGGFFLPEVKEDKGILQKQQDVDLLSLESKLLKRSLPDSISIITTSETSVLANLPLPDLFPQIKRAEAFSLDKDVEMLGRSAAVAPSELDSNSNLLLDDVALWKDLNLPCSLPALSDSELDAEVAHLDDMLQGCRSGGTPLGDFPKDVKPGPDNGFSCPSVNGSKRPAQQLQPAPLLSSVRIKVEEKDPEPSFMQIRPPGGVKQEKGDADAFCQAALLQSSMRSVYSYGTNPASAVAPQDQKPFGFYPTLPVSSEGWSAGGPYGDSAGIPRADDGVPSITVLGTFPSSFSR